MKIDLHCHTKAVKNGDGSGRNVTPELFKEKIENADIKIVAITNHNAFDLDQYKVLSESVKGSCLVWPGVEIDVLEPGSKRWHLIVVANPKESVSFAKSVSNLFREDNLEDCTHSLDEIYDSFCNHDAIYIAHFHKKPAIPDEDGEKLDRLINNPHRVFKETSNESSMSIFANYRYNVLLGSDVKDWRHYEKCTFSELKLPVDSFEQFCLLSKRDENVVKTLLNKKDSKRLIAHPAPRVNLPIQIYADMNIIFGQKGTGKTQIIKTLCDSMKAGGLKCVSYIATEREDDFKTILSHKGMVVDLDKMGAKDCEHDFQILSNWIDDNPTHFGNYINWKRTEGNNANKARMRITRASALVREEQDNEDLHKTDKDNVDELYRVLQEITLKEYLSEDEASTLMLLARKLKDTIYDYRLYDLIDKNAVDLVNFSINKIKENADRNTNSVSKPSTVGLTGFVEARLKLFKAINSILNHLETPEINEKK